MHVQVDIIEIIFIFNHGIIQRILLLIPIFINIRFVLREIVFELEHVLVSMIKISDLI